VVGLQYGLGFAKLFSEEKDLAKPRQIFYFLDSAEREEKGVWGK